MRQVTLDVPDKLFNFLTASGHTLERTALEDIALEGYREKKLSTLNCGACSAITPERRSMPFSRSMAYTCITALWIWSTTGKPVMPSRYYQPHDRYCRYEPAEYLALIQQADLLSRLFGRVLISPAVF